MYTDIISLSDAKTYLGVDDTARDAEITRIINSALTYLERSTNVILFPRDKTYIYADGCVRVYDYPINSTTSTTHEVEVKTLYSIYTDNGSEGVILNVGYTDPADIPADLIETGYAIIECLFEGGKLADLPTLIKTMIFSNKRFVI